MCFSEYNSWVFVGNKAEQLATLWPWSQIYLSSLSLGFNGHGKHTYYGHWIRSSNIPTMYLFIPIGYYLLARSNPDVSSWELSHDNYMLRSYVVKLYSFFYPHMHNLQYFSTLGHSFVSMFVLLTTAKWVPKLCCQPASVNAAVTALTSYIYSYSSWSYRCMHE